MRVEGSDDVPPTPDRCGRRRSRFGKGILTCRYVCSVSHFVRDDDSSKRRAGPRDAGKRILVEIGAGELIDKITILRIKSERMTDAAQLANVRRELAVLGAARDASLPASTELSALESDLEAINNALWRIEDDIRACEAARDFGPGFVELARAVYTCNDRRAAIKKQINLLTGSSLIEEKSYVRAP